MSSSDGDGISISSIFTTPATTGCHMLKIDGYSKTKLFGAWYHRAASPTFEAAGQNWCISYYPTGTGSTSASADHISVFISPCSPITGNTRATIRFSLVPHAGKPAPPPYCKSFVAAFNHNCVPRPDACGFECFIKREELEKSEYLVDDCFAIRCDVEVTKLLSAPAPAEDPAVRANDLERLALPCTCDDGQCKRIHLPRAVEAASPRRGDGGGLNKSPETEDRGCVSNKDKLDNNLCKHRAVEAPPPQPQGRRRRAMAEWFRLFPGAGKFETETTQHQTTCASLKKPLLSEIN
ncbi:unnamed protein product [Urochloa humidicola]